MLNFWPILRVDMLIGFMLTKKKRVIPTENEVRVLRDKLLILKKKLTSKKDSDDLKNLTLDFKHFSFLSNKTF